MKTAHKFIALAVAGFGFVSCCGIDNNYASGTKMVEKEVTSYEEKIVTVTPSGKDGMPYTKVVKVPVSNKTVKVEEKCVCTDVYYPEPDCCGQLSDEVVSRATIQSGTGEPHLGLIPTMRPLVIASEE